MPTLSWESWRERWPNAESSRFVESAGIRWHVQCAGRGPAVLLLHGTGGATHSWAALLPALARDHTVIAPDLPGHGFTTSADESASLAGMSSALTALCRTLDVAPSAIVAHSAGTAIALAMSRAAQLAPTAIIGFAAALVPPAALYNDWLAPFISPIARSDWFASLGAELASSRAISDIPLSLSSRELPPEQAERYRALFASKEHVHGAFAMMASWDIAALLRSLAGVSLPPITLIHGSNDRLVRYEALARIAATLPSARLIRWEGAGHLLHEERPVAAEDAVRAVISDPSPADRPT